MQTYKPNLVFIIFVISFYCSVAIGSPLSGAEHSSPSRDIRPVAITIKEQAESLTIEEILSPKKYLKRYLETEKKEGLREISPDTENQQFVVENETSSNAGENDSRPAVSPTGDATTSVAGEQSPAGEEKGTQTPAVNNTSRQTVTAQKSPSPPSVVAEKGSHEDTLSAEGSSSKITEKKIPPDIQKTDVSSTPTIPGSATTLADEQQFPAIDESVAQTRLEDSKSHPPLAGEESLFPIFVDKKSYLEKYLNGERHQPGTSFSETLQETLGVSTPMAMAIATPELQSETIAGGESSPTETMGIQTLGAEDKSHQITDESRSTFTPSEDSSSAATKGSQDIRIDEAKEPEKRTSAPEPLTETGKEAEDLKSSWDIWHTNPTLSVIIAVAITLIAAKTGGWLASLVALPEVVGQLILGIVLGNFFFVTGSEFFNFLTTMPFLKMIAYFGTLLLLLTAGLHTDIRALLRVGASSFLVSLGGIIAPAGLGLIVGHFLLSDSAFSSKLLLAIIICNTSTGLLFAILTELKAMNTIEGRIITGATLLTEIIVILTFGIASGIATKGEVSVTNLLVTAGIAFSFLVVVLIIVLKYGERFGNFLTSRAAEGLKISIVITVSLLFAFISGSIGLHGVIGAFAAGLLLRNVKFKDSDDKEYSTVERVIRPYYMVLVPILFVRVGAQVDLKSILNMEAALLGLAITGAAVVGKLFCSICPFGKGINRMAIGIGMAMKLEGTLILSGIGRDIGILNDVVFSSIIMVIVFTSITCPSLLKASLVRHKRRLSKNFRVTVDEKTKEISVQFKSTVRE
ncbi:MAG: hypothetical protein CV087_16295 [Candidatus Brocadia sp. WS118]|nr:MAG: hypothetical protein CV087_16295 [Candidatus Brocadia sp. WS118]